MLDTQTILRFKIRQQRLSLTPKARQAASHAATNHFIQSLWFKQSQNIAVYMAHHNEIDPHEIISAVIKQGKQCYLPVVNSESKQLTFLSFHPEDQLTKNIYDIPEPSRDNAQEIDTQELDAIVTPLVAFDESGTRLGMGAGYYDRTFAFLKKNPRPKTPKLIGFAYEFQQVAKLHRQPWDVALDVICTENGIINALPESSSTHLE